MRTKKPVRKSLIKLGIIGGGNMAEALVSGLLNQHLFKPAEVIVSEPQSARRRRLGRLYRIETTADNDSVVRQAGAIVLAVKPQTIDSVISEIAPVLNTINQPAIRGARAGTGRLFISIAAGVTIARLENALGLGARVIRSMPNAPAMVGAGMTAIVRGSRATKNDESFALSIFRAVGDAIALRDESLLDAVTALSGSGPAYVYLFVAALVAGAVSEGLPRPLALRMTLQTIAGAEKSLRTLKLSPEELIRRVASPGGTTEAALAKFDAAGFSDIVKSALKAAADRSRELGR
jgi:pyrroline-5-carboxylate reductase